MPIPNINGWIEDSIRKKLDPNAPSMGPADPNAPFVSDVPPDVSALEAAGYGALAGITAPIDVAGFNLNPLRGPLSQNAQTVASQVGREHDIATPIGEYAGMAANPVYNVGGRLANKFLKSMFPGVNTLSREKFLAENPLPPRQASNPGEWDWEHFTGNAADITPGASVAEGLARAPDAPMPTPGPMKALPSPPFAQWKPEGGPENFDWSALGPVEKPVFKPKEGFTMYKPKGPEASPLPEADPSAMAGALSPAQASVADFKKQLALPAAPEKKALKAKEPFSEEYLPGGSRISGGTPKYLLQFPEYLKSMMGNKLIQFESSGKSTQDAILENLANLKLQAPMLDEESIKNLMNGMSNWEFLGAVNPMEAGGLPSQMMSLQNTLNRKTPAGDELIRNLGSRYNDAFRKWYEGSKAATAEGKPRLWFHGTRMEPDFDPESTDKRYFRQFKPGRSDPGVHFGTPEAAWQIHGKMLAGDRSKRIYPALLNLQNPLEVPDLGSWGPKFWVDRAGTHPNVGLVADEFNRINKTGNPLAYAIDDMDKMPLQLETLRQAIRNLGYDSLMYQNTVEDPSSISYVSLDPKTQVKSVFNQGTWDPTNPDMMRATDTKSFQAGLPMGSEELSFGGPSGGPSTGPFGRANPGASKPADVVDINKNKKEPPKFKAGDRVTLRDDINLNRVIHLPETAPGRNDQLGNMVMPDAAWEILDSSQNPAQAINRLKQAGLKNYVNVVEQYFRDRAENYTPEAIKGDLPIEWFDQMVKTHFAKRKPAANEPMDTSKRSPEDNGLDAALGEFKRQYIDKPAKVTVTKGPITFTPAESKVFKSLKGNKVSVDAFNDMRRQALESAKKRGVPYDADEFLAAWRRMTGRE